MGPSCWASASAAVWAPAKLNLLLKVTGRRPDGYHLLDSIVAPVAIYDRICVSVSASRAPRVGLKVSPAGLAPDDDSNLCIRAARLYLEQSGMPADVRIELHKEVPVGAGLGGGSSDAAATLRLLNVLAPTSVPPSRLQRWALELGADVPFFLLGGPARMQGIGESLTPIRLAAAVGSLVVAFPGVSLGTRHVYAKYDDSLTSEAPLSRVREFVVGRAPLHEWLENDLEVAAFQILPVLENLKRRLRALGAQGVSMTGSGSAIFGVWSCAKEAADAVRKLLATGVWARTTSILDTLPRVVVHDA